LNFHTAATAFRRMSSGAVWLYLHFTLSELLAPVDGRFTEGFRRARSQQGEGRSRRSCGADYAFGPHNLVGGEGPDMALTGGIGRL
jgi:hypothetical protein